MTSPFRSVLVLTLATVIGCGGFGWYWFDYDNRTDAQKKRSEAVKSGACKCPAGQNC